MKQIFSRKFEDFSDPSLFCQTKMVIWLTLTNTQAANLRNVSFVLFTGVVSCRWRWCCVVDGDDDDELGSHLQVFAGDPISAFRGERVLLFQGKWMAAAGRGWGNLLLTRSRKVLSKPGSATLDDFFPPPANNTVKLFSAVTGHGWQLGMSTLRCMIWGSRLLCT